MTVRLASPDDVEDLAALDRACFGEEAWSARQLAEEFSGGRVVLASEQQDALIGYASVSVVAEDAELLRIGVVPAHRGRGAARELLDEAWRRAQARGASRLLLEVDATNAAALRLYDAFGFALLARRRGYYRGRDALVMELRR